MTKRDCTPRSHFEPCGNPLFSIGSNLPAIGVAAAPRPPDIGWSEDFSSEHHVTFPGNFFPPCPFPVLPGYSDRRRFIETKFNLHSLIGIAGRDKNEGLQGSARTLNGFRFRMVRSGRTALS